MGRKSREKLRRRVDPLYKARVHAARAEARGRRVPPTREAYKRVARLYGSSGIVEALISRHNQRWENIGLNVKVMGDSVVGTLHVLFPLDVFFWKSGVRFTKAPSNPYGNWPEHLRWAADSACQVSRMFVCCNVLGAAAVARTQLERWSLNRSSSNEIEQPDGMST